MKNNCFDNFPTRVTGPGRKIMILKQGMKVLWQCQKENRQNGSQISWIGGIQLRVSGYKSWCMEKEHPSGALESWRKAQNRMYTIQSIKHPDPSHTVQGNEKGMLAACKSSSRGKPWALEGKGANLFSAGQWNIWLPINRLWTSTSPSNYQLFYLSYLENDKTDFSLVI